MSEEVILKVAFEFEMEGLPAIVTQFSKSSPETCNEKELQLSLPVLTDTEEVFIGSLNVIAILVFFTIPVALSEGDEDEKVGFITSIIIALLAPSEPDEPGEVKVRVASLVALSLIVPLFVDREPVAL